MKRVIVYDVEQTKSEISSAHSDRIQDSQKKQETWSQEKRKRAMKTIENAATLSNVVKSIKEIKLNDPNSDGPVVKEAIDKIASIVEEMKLEFKKDYWD